MRKQYLFLLLAVVSLSVIFAGSTPADAQTLLRMDFGLGSGDSVAQPGFENMIGEQTQDSATQAFGDYTVEVLGQGFFQTPLTTGVTNLIDPSIRDLYRDYYFNNSRINGVGVTLRITGVTPNTDYDLILWSYDANVGVASATPTSWSPGLNTTGTPVEIVDVREPIPTEQYDEDNYKTIRVQSTTSTLEVFGTVVGTDPTAPDTVAGTRLNAFVLNNLAQDVLLVDFGRVNTPSPVQADFSSGAGPQSTDPFETTANGFTVKLSEGEGFFNSSNANANTMDASVRNLYRDYYYNNSTIQGNGVTLTIEGVTPDTDYDLKVWSYDPAGHDATETSWTPFGDTTGTPGTIINDDVPRPVALEDYSATIRVRSTGTSLQLFGTTLGGNDGTRLNGIELSLASDALAGDHNGDGMVDAADYVFWRDTMSGDPDGYNDWKANFGATNQGSSTSQTAVPEPQTLLLGLLGMLLVARFRKDWR